MPDKDWWAVEADLKVGVTGADGLVEATGLDFESTRGLIGFDVVEEPTI